MKTTIWSVRVDFAGMLDDINAATECAYMLTAGALH